MSRLSAFDIIGPSMIGPSSSHTAGAAKIANNAYNQANELDSSGIKSVEFVLYGSFAKTFWGHGTDKALLAGIMGFTEDSPEIANAEGIAKEKGLEFKFEADFHTEDKHPNSVLIKIKMTSGNRFDFEGESVGGGEIGEVRLSQKA